MLQANPRCLEKKKEASRIHVALRDCNFEKLCELRATKTKKQSIENDIYEFLKTLETEKNLILFFPYKFDFDNEHEFIDGVQQIQEALNSDFQCAMQYRNHVANGFDTYMAFIYDKHIVFMEEENNMFSFIDSVELTKSPVYQNLSRYGGMI